MDEAKMTDADMAQREKIVKSMKKNFKDFRSRYGARAKEVMYATATKMAMKEEETSEEKGEYDYEGDMAKSSLKTIIRNAQMMHDMLSEDTNLPEWVQGKITLAEDYIVSATQYMQSEMKEEVELDEISKETAWKAAEKASKKAHTWAAAAISGKDPYKSKFEKAVRQHNKITAYASAKTPKVPFVHHEEVDLEEGETKKINKAMKNQYHMEKGATVRKAFKDLRPSGKNLPHSANVRTGRLLDRDKTGTILNLKSGIDPRPGVGFNKKMKEEVEVNEGSYNFNPGYESKNKRIQKKAEAGMEKNWKQYAKNTQLPRSQRRSALIATDPKQVKKSEWGTHGNRYVKHAFGPYMGESAENTPTKKEETPKKKYKKMRSQERFDARFKEVDNNYPYRSDN